MKIQYGVQRFVFLLLYVLSLRSVPVVWQWHRVVWQERAMGQCESGCPTLMLVLIDFSGGLCGMKNSAAYFSAENVCFNMH